MYEYRARVVKVVDGDTMHLDIDLGLDVRTKMTVRLYGVDAPELHGDDDERGHLAKVFAETALPVGSLVRVYTIKDRREKFGRYLASIIYADADLREHNLADELVRRGLAERK